MNALRQRLLNTSDTPCDLIALAAEAVHAPATSPVVHSRHDDDTSDSSCPSPRKHYRSARRSYPPEASERIRLLSPKSRAVTQNEIDLSDQERPWTGPTTAAIAPALRSPGPDHDDDSQVGKAPELENRSRCALHDSPSASQKKAEVVTLHILKEVPDVLTMAHVPASSAEKPLTKIYSSLSSDLSRSEAAFEANVGASHQVHSQREKPEEEITPLVPYSCTSNGISSTRVKGSSPPRKLRTSKDPDGNLCELAPIDDGGRMRAATPAIPAPRFQAEEQEESVISREAVDSKVNYKRQSTRRCFRGNMSRGRRAKKAKKQDIFFSKPSGSKFDELVSCGRLDKHLLMQERTFQRVQVGAMQSLHVAQSVGVQKRKKRSHRSRQ